MQACRAHDAKRVNDDELLQKTKDKLSFKGRFWNFELFWKIVQVESIRLSAPEMGPTIADKVETAYLGPLIFRLAPHNLEDSRQKQLGHLAVVV